MIGAGRFIEKNTFISLIKTIFVSKNDKMKIQLTESASLSYDEIINKYSENKAAAFASETISVLDMIEKNNHIGASHKKTPYRKFLISDQVYLFYKIETNFIYISLFWDNKRNPLDLEIILSS
jgi:hypothetical protein